MPTIDALFAREGVTPCDIGLVGVSVGPGGYTACRVSCAAAAMIAEGASAVRDEAVMVAPVESEMVVAESVIGGHEKVGGFVVVLASKGESAWACGFTGGRDARGLPEVMEGFGGSLVEADRLAGAKEAGGARVIADRFLPGTFVEKAGELGMVVDEPVFDAMVCARVAVLVARQGDGGEGGEGGCVDAASLRPRYPRVPDAVRQWEERKGKSGV